MKKGQLAIIFADLASYIFFALIVLLFYLLFAVSKTTVVFNIDARVPNLEVEQLLMGYLGSSVNVDNQKLMSGELIELVEVMPEYKDVLVAHTQKVFEQYGVWKFTLNIDYYQNKISICGSSGCVQEEEELVVEALAGVPFSMTVTSKVELPSLTKVNDTVVELRIQELVSNE